MIGGGAGMVDYADDVDGVILEDDEQGNDSEPQEEDAETRRYSDMAFNPWRFAATVKAEALVREAVQAVEAAETRQKNAGLPIRKSSRTQ